MDLEMIKEIPGYKIILKAVLKSQIQQLVGYLASLTEEESVLLTANVSDGSFSQLGSDSGKVFLEHREDLKSEFLGFCLKRHMEGIKKQNQQVSKLGQQNLCSNNLSQHTKLTASTGKAVRHKPYPSSKPKSGWESTIIQTKSPTIEIDTDDTFQNDDAETYPHNAVNIKEEFDDVDDPTYFSSNSQHFNTSDVNDSNDTSVQEEEEVNYQASTQTDYDTSWQPGPSRRVTPPAPRFHKPNEEKQTFGFPCNHCGKIFGAKCDLIRHNMVHTGEKPYPCPVCSKKFRQKVHRRSHMARHHPKEALTAQL